MVETSKDLTKKWERKHFGQIFQFLKTASNPRDDLCKYENDDDYKYIHYGDVHTHTSIFLDCANTTLPYISRKKIQNTPTIQEGDIVMVDASEDYAGLGKSVEIKNLHEEKIVAGLHTFLLRGKKEHVIDGFKALIQFIPEFRNSLNVLATGVSVYGISKNNLKNVEISLPEPSEQLKITEILSEIISLIDSLNSLIQKKKNIKHGTMQELLTGKRRLEGFSGEWESKTLDKVANFFSGGTPLTSISEYYGGEIPWIVSGDLNSRFIIEVNGRITEKGLNNSSAKMVKENTLLIALYGATAGVVAISLIRASINQAVLAIIPCSIDTKFLFYKLEFLKDWIITTYTQGGQPNLSANIIKSIKMEFPSEDEQEAISKILSDMDSEIEQLESQKEKYINLKQAMMQKLLTGEIRLV